MGNFENTLAYINCYTIWWRIVIKLYNQRIGPIFILFACSSPGFAARVELINWLHSFYPATLPRLFFSSWLSHYLPPLCRLRRWSWTLRSVHSVFFYSGFMFWYRVILNNPSKATCYIPLRRIIRMHFPRRWVWFGAERSRNPICLRYVRIE